MDIRKKVASSTTNPLNDRNKDTNKNLQIKLLAEYFSRKFFYNLLNSLK